MTLADQEFSSGAPQREFAEMTSFGITRVQVDYFHYKEFRYTQLADAIAEAKRDESRLCKPSGGYLAPEKRTLRHGLLSVWREARRANLSFPQGREPTQEQMEEQKRLGREQETARVKLAEFDAAH